MSISNGIVLNGRYSLLDILGQGVSSIVYRALDIHSNTYVAVKVLRPEFSSSPHLLSRFEREVKASERLRSPHLVALLDWGVQGGQYYIVLELAKGDTLRTIINKRQVLSASESLDITLQILEGLKAVHAAGLIHRDLKPENIILTSDGTVKVMDFGIAKDTTMVTLTFDGSLLGTPRYVAPEQARGEKLDCRTDIYAVGAILFEMLSGKPPFQADNFYAMTLKHVNEVPPSLSGLDPKIPQSLDTLVQKALIKQPANRYQNAGEMIEAIRNFLGLDFTVMGVPPLPAPLLKKPNNKRNWLMVGMALTFSLIAVLLVVVAVLTLTQSEPTRSAQAVTPAPTSSPPITEALSVTLSANTILTTPGSIPSKSSSDENSRLLDDANTAIVNGDWKKAITILESLRKNSSATDKIDTQLAVAYCIYGKQIVRTGDPAEAQSTLEKCLTLDSANLDAKTLLPKIKSFREANDFSIQQNWGAAVPLWEKMYELDKSFRDTEAQLANGYLNLIKAFANSKNYAEALSLCTKAGNTISGDRAAAINTECKKIVELTITPTPTPRITTTAPVAITTTAQRSCFSNFYAYNIGQPSVPNVVDLGKSSVGGLVINRNKVPIPSATVRISSGGYSFVTMTNGGGRYSIGGLGKGVWNVVVIAAPGYSLCTSLSGAVTVSGQPEFTGYVDFVESEP